ncbi:MAG: hypothetical protein J1F23_08110 [Oscillospiraceae bacterium]|nr:hypothetical protein [Oscillospiraceae bacterium]
MPYIDANVSVKLDDEKIEKIKSDFGKAITLIPGKSESYLMVKISDGCNLFFKGDSSPAAMCSVSIFGSADDQSCEALTKEICDILEREADIPSSRTYVKFRFVDTWGYNGFLF